MFPPPRPGRSIRNAVWVLLLAVALARCAGHGSLDRRDAEALVQGGQTIVLMRLTAENDDAPFDAISRFAGTDGYGVRIVNLGSGQDETVGPPFSTPDAQARQDGWVWFAAGPGDYFLQVFPPLGSAGARRERPWRDAQYRVSIPEKGGVQYVGSFHARCSSTWGIFGRLVDECFGQPELADESTLARGVTARAVGQKAVLTAQIARHYDHRPPPGELAGVMPVVLAVTAGSPWQNPDWNRLRERSHRPAGGAGLGGGGCYGPGCGALAFLALSVWAGAALVDSALDDQERRKWEPCAGRIAGVLPELGLPEALHSHVVEAAGPGSGITGAAGGASSTACSSST